MKKRPECESSSHFGFWLARGLGSVYNLLHNVLSGGESIKMIDFHVHLFPDVLAEKTLEKLSRTAADEHGNAPYFSDATVRGTLEKMDAWGVDAAVTQHIATSVRSMHKVNDFAASVLCDRLYAFGSVHPDAPDAPEELEPSRRWG